MPLSTLLLATLALPIVAMRVELHPQAPWRVTRWLAVLATGAGALAVPLAPVVPLDLIAPIALAVIVGGAAYDTLAMVSPGPATPTRRQLLLAALVAIAVVAGTAAAAALIGVRPAQFLLAGVMIAVLALLAWIRWRRAIPAESLRAVYMFVGLLPLMPALLAGSPPATLLLAAIWHLCLQAYACQAEPLFDMAQHFARSHARNHVVYRRLRQLRHDVLDGIESDEAARTLADTLGCAVAIVGLDRVYRAGNTEASARLVSLPLDSLPTRSGLFRRDTLSRSAPDQAQLFRRHGISAGYVVVRVPGERPRGWILFGPGLERTIYSQQDWRTLDDALELLGALFRDQVVVSRRNLEAKARVLKDQAKRIRTLRSQLYFGQTIGNDAKTMADTLTATMAAHGESAWYIGRDRELLGALRAQWPAIEHFTTPRSRALEDRRLPDTIVYHHRGNRTADVEELVNMLKRESERTRCFVLDANADVTPLLKATSNVVLLPRDTTTEQLLAELLRQGDGPAPVVTDVPTTMAEAVDNFEKLAIQRALVISQGRHGAAARLVGMARPRFSERLKEHGIDAPPVEIWTVPLGTEELQVGKDVTVTVLSINEDTQEVRIGLEIPPNMALEDLQTVGTWDTTWRPAAVDATDDKVAKGRA